jgi:hypothetical protein
VPSLGKTFNLVPVSGLVFIRLPHPENATTHGFIPLTETRQLPPRTLVDARAGTLQVVSRAVPAEHIGKTQTITLTGAIFKFMQTNSGSNAGLTTFTLVEGAFPGAPSFASCVAKVAGDGPVASAASKRVLQALLAREPHGRFRTVGRFSAGTVRARSGGPGTGATGP